MSSSNLFAHDSILTPDPVGDDGAPLEVLHDREYRVRAFRKRDDLVLIRGAIRDQKPPGLYIDIDPDPLTVHHMQLDIEVAYPSMEIVAANVVFETHPNAECPQIIDHYDGLIGLSVARGFNHKVRDLFGGPRACTHTTALLQAMAPVAVQCVWSMQAAITRRNAANGIEQSSSVVSRSDAWKMNLNTCHVWAEDSPVVASLIAGEPMPAPVFAEERLINLGLKPDEWRKRIGG
ncbi:MAG: hypothetical protein ACJA14_001594 [Ilumatobacter sp.]|jgi:hypothetical protein